MTQLSPFFHLLLNTLIQRPYVFAFLIVFVLFASLQFGVKRMLLFLGLGWIIAFASEVSSIRNGFPYGDYQYVYENMKNELILWGVPLWDSLSYTFLAYASYATATLLFFKPENFLNTRSSFKVLFLASFLMMGIDVIIDPLTAMGDRWFLGRIYYYPNGGFYFGVPLSNFAGWFLVAFTIIFIFQRLDKRLEASGNPVDDKRWKGFMAWLGVALYLGVYLFNWSITVWLKEWNLVIADLILLSPLIYFLVKKYQQEFSKQN